MERKGLRLDWEPAPPVLVSGDARRLQQVLRNLLSNAVRFTPAGGTITDAHDAHAPATWRSPISDTGAGIDLAFLPHVFEPFRQQPGRRAAGSGDVRARAVRWRGSSSSGTAAG